MSDEDTEHEDTEHEDTEHEDTEHEVIRAVVDTNVLIALDPREGEEPPNLTGLDLRITSITTMELQYGIVCASNDPIKMATRQLRLTRTIATMGAGIPFDDAAAGSYGLLAKVDLVAGRDPKHGVLDRMIASIAHARQVGVVTRDGRMDGWRDHVQVIKR